MITFVPYADFRESAACLDYKRLGKQRVEAKQLLNGLRDGKGWVHHPASKMWKGYEEALALYFNSVREEWIRRGYNNTMLEEKVNSNIYAIVLPPWVGDERVHSSHRARLLDKFPEHYSQFGWSELASSFYYWPVR